MMYLMHIFLFYLISTDTSATLGMDVKYPKPLPSRRVTECYLPFMSEVGVLNKMMYIKNI